MRFLSFTPTTSYLIFSNALKNTVSPSRTQQCLLQQSKNSVSAASVILCKKIFQRSDTGFFYNGGLGYLSASYCTRPFEKTKLMRNFPICVRPSLSNAFKVFCGKFAMRNLDQEFNITEFLHNTKKVLEIVTKLIAEANFSELEGLLTDDCRNEVKLNVKNLELSRRKHLEVKAENIINMFVDSIEIIKVPEGNNERVFVEILVAYSIFELNKDSWESFFQFPSLEDCAVYNAKFIREYTPGVEDQWTISAINICRFVEYHSRQ